MRVRLDGPLASYELQTWAEAGGLGGGHRLRIHELGEARSLLRRLVFDNPGASLRALVGELDGGFGFGFGAGLDGEELIERLAQAVVRGRIIVERRPVELRASDQPATCRPELLAPAPEFEGNEFEDEHRVIHWLIPTPPPEIVLEPRHEGPPALVLGSGSEAPPRILITAVATPPPRITIGSLAEAPPSITTGSGEQPPPQLSITTDSDDQPPPQLAVGSELGA